MPKRYDLVHAAVVDKQRCVDLPDLAARVVLVLNEQSEWEERKHSLADSGDRGKRLLDDHAADRDPGGEVHGDGGPERLAIADYAGCGSLFFLAQEAVGGLGVRVGAVFIGVSLALAVPPVINDQG